MLIETTPIKNTNDKIILMPDQSQVRQYTSIGSYTIVYVTRKGDFVSAKAIEEEFDRFEKGEDKIIDHFVIYTGSPFYCEFVGDWIG